MRNLHDTFAEYVRDRNAYYLVGNLVLPLTKPCRLSFSEAIGAVRMEWFVSHFWGSPYLHFLSSLEKHSEATKRGDAQGASYCRRV